MLSYNITNSGVIIVSVDNKPLPPVAKDHINYDKIKEALKANDGAEIERLVDVSSQVTSFVNKDGSKVSVRDGVVFYENAPIENCMSDRIVGFMKEGYPVEPMFKFLENLMQNESYHSIQQLYTFLQNQSLPITEDGYFLAYKRVSEDWMDLHTCTIDNSIGKEVTMPRNQVDDNFNQGCSRGLHVGAISYVSGFGTGGHVIICKVHPKDVVSVPNEDCTKLRCCKYLVVDEYKGDLDKLLYASTGAPFEVPQPAGFGGYQGEDEFDNEFDEEDEDEDEDEEFDEDENDDKSPFQSENPFRNDNYDN